MHTPGAVFKCSVLARSQICVASLATGREILRTHTGRLQPLSLPLSPIRPGGLLRWMEEPAHESSRQLFSSVRARPLVKRRAAILQRRVVRGLARLERASLAAGVRGVSPLPSIERLVLEGWVSLFFGVEGESREATRLGELFLVIDIRHQRRAPWATVRAALDSIEEFVTRRVADATIPLASRRCARPACCQSSSAALPTRSTIRPASAA